MRWILENRVSMVVLAAVCVLATCSSSGDGQMNPVSEKGSQVSTQAVGTVLDVVADPTDGNSNNSGSTSPFVVKVSSGYLRDLMDSTFGENEVDYSPLLGANYTLDNSEIVVAGYLFEIVAGVTESEISAQRPLTEAEKRIALTELDERERSMEASGATPADRLELEQERRAVRENEIPRLNNFNYAAYRIRVTEVFRGDINVGEILDVQVYAGVNIGSKWVDPVLAGTPRVVVAGSWGKQSSRLELRDAGGEPIDGAFWPHSDLFWLDEGIWELLEVDTSGGISETGGPDGSGSVPSDLLEDDTPDVGTGALENNLVERPAPIPEAHYLEGLHALDDAWGNLETLDHLATVLRSAAVELSAPRTTVTTGDGVPPTSVADVASTTVPVP